MAKSCIDIHIAKINTEDTQLAAFEKFNTLKKIYLEIAPHLSQRALLVLTFIYMRTIFWGKTTEVISTDTFLVYGVAGHIAPLNMTRPTLRAALSELQSLGIVNTEMSAKGNRYTFKHTWSGDMLRIPKNAGKKSVSNLKNPKEGGEKFLPRGGKNFSLGGEKILPTKYMNNKYENINVECEAEPAQDIHAAIASARARSNEARMKKVERARNNPQSVASLFTVWENAVRTHFPDYPVVQPWTRKQLGQMADFRAAFAKSNPGMKVSAFIEFCVQHWRRIGVLHFSNLKNGNFPTYPDVGFMMGMKRGFLTSFADNDFAERTAKLTEADRKVAKLIRQGYTREEAERAVQQDTGSRRALEQQLAESERARLDNIALKRKLEEAKRDNRDLRQQASVGAKERVLSRFEKSVVKVRVRTDDAELEALPGWSEE